MQIVFEMPEEARKELQTGKAGHFQAVMEGITLVGADESQMVNIPFPALVRRELLSRRSAFGTAKSAFSRWRRRRGQKRRKRNPEQTQTFFFTFQLL